MHISRSLGIHKCTKCGEKLIDDNFECCGIYLSGPDKNRAFFNYHCPTCNSDDSYIIDPDVDDLPGNMFRQFADGLDAAFYKPDVDAGGIENIDDIVP